MRFLSIWMALGAAAILLLTEKIVLELPSELTIWLVLFLMIILSWRGYRDSKITGDSPWLSPLFLYFAWIVTFQYVMGLFIIRYFLEWNANFFAFYSLAIARQTDYLQVGSRLIALGALGSYIGMRIPVRWMTGSFPAINWNIDEHRFLGRALVYVPIAGLSRYVYQLHIVPMSVDLLFYIIGNSGWLLLVYGLMRWIREGRLSKGWFIVMVGIFLGYLPEVVLYGTRNYLFSPFLFAVWTYFAFKDRINLRAIVLVLTVGFFLFIFIFAWLTPYKQFRSAHGSGYSILESAEEATEALAQTFLSSGAAIDSLYPFFTFMTTYSFSAQNVVTFPQYYPDSFPFLYGESFLNTMLLIIPRMFFPEKPNSMVYYNMIAVTAELQREDMIGRSSNFVDSISEYYINFGAIGVFIISILHGFYLMARYDWLIRRSEISIGFPIYAVSMYSTSAFWHVFVLDIKFWPVWIVLLWFLSRRS